jgi:hypothetical protein
VLHPDLAYRYDQNCLSLLWREWLPKCGCERNFEVLAIVKQVLYLLGNFEKSLAPVIIFNHLLKCLQYSDVSHDRRARANTASHQPTSEITQDSL